MPPFNSRPFSAVGAQVAITCVGYLLAIPIGTAILADRFIQWVKGEREDPTKTLWRNAKLEDPVPNLHHKWLSVNGIKIHAVRCDSETSSPPKPVMLLVHGFPQAWFAWQYQMQHFRDRYDVWALDMRGYNESDKPEGVSAYLRSHLVSDIAEVVKQISPERKVTLVAHDWGAVVAWDFARAFPQYLSHLVILCAPHPKIFLERMSLAQMRRSWYIMLFQTPFVPEMLLSMRSFVVIDRMLTGVRSGLHNRDQLSEEDVMRYKQALARPGSLSATINYYRALYRFDPNAPRPVRGKLKVPTLLMWADGDVAFKETVFQGTERFVEDIRIVQLADCSHFAPEDCPEQVNAQIDRFLSDHANALNAKL